MGGAQCYCVRMKTDAAELQIVFFTPYNFLPCLNPAPVLSTIQFLSTVRLEIQVCDASGG